MAFRAVVAGPLLSALVMMTGFLMRPLGGDPSIARVRAVNGTFRWILDGRTIIHDLPVGTELPGGTVEGVTPDAWVSIEFNDGSTVTLSGIGMLTFSDDGQKNLHLKEGGFTASVTPQPDGAPMLVHTRTARLQVVGTRFRVDAGDFESTLNVTEGRVLLTRLSDGTTLDVPAKHLATAAPDRELRLLRASDIVHDWTSALEDGPQGNLGRWSPATNRNRAALTAVPYRTEAGTTIYTVGLSVSRGDRPPVAVDSSATLQVQGLLEFPHDVFFGMTVRDEEGEFAGRFQTIVRRQQLPADTPFDIQIQLGELTLDPSLKEMQHLLPDSPEGLIVESVWCHSLYDQVGLAVTRVDLAASTPNLPQ